MEMIILDFETTGLNPQYDRIIEVAAIKIHGTKVVGRFSELTNPGVPIPSFVSSLTGITQSMLKGKPSPESLMPTLKKFIGEDIIVGHNASFDKRFLVAEMGRANIAVHNKTLCTMLLSRRLIPNLYDYKLSTLAQYLNIDSTKAHRALADVEMTAKLWDHLYGEVARRTGIKKPQTELLLNIIKKSKSAVDKYLASISGDEL